MTLGRIDLVGPIDCVRLSLHGGSLLAGLRPRLVTTRLPRAVRSRRFQISTAIRTSPPPPVLMIPSNGVYVVVAGRDATHVEEEPDVAEELRRDTAVVRAVVIRLDLV